MKTLIKQALFALLLGILAAPTFGTTAITHETIPIYSAYEGNSQGNARLWSGYTETPSPTIAAYPGALIIDPGDHWSNFISAAQASVTYTVKSVTLTKHNPSSTMCADVYPGAEVTQEGTPNIRLNWPLEYEAPGTTWTLQILYSTPTMWDDDGPTGMNPPAVLHVDVWKWELQDDTTHLGCLLNLFHDLGAGTSGTPPISDELLFSSLVSGVNHAKQVEAEGDTPALWSTLNNIELEVMDACALYIPPNPAPSGGATGILLTSEYPACCKLIADIEYILSHTGLVYPAPRPEAMSISAGAPGRMLCRNIGVCSASAGDSAGNATVYRGYLGSATGPVVFPSVLGIAPGDNWGNFIAAARASVPYTLGEVTLTKTTPAAGSCTGAAAATTVTQSGDGIRLWWPLMYEAPGTTFTLAVSYETAAPQRFADEHMASIQHQETWRWTVRDDLQSLDSISKLFNEMSFGTSGVPLISDETLYDSLSDTLGLARTSLAAGDVPAVQSAVDSFGLAVLDACTSTAPQYPNPSGSGTGVLNTEDSPAGCRLLAGSAETNTVAAINLAEVVRSAKDGSSVVFGEPKVVTLVQPGYFYAQDLNRVCGLKVIGSVDGLQPGGTIKLRGTLGTDGPERVLQLAGCEVQTPTGDLPRSPAIRASRIGGQGSAFLPGFIDGTGLFNGGLLVTVVGQVKSTGLGCFHIDDGSAPAGSGLMVILPTGVEPPSGTPYMRVTGISTWFDNNGQAEPAILVASDEGVTVVR